MVDDKNDRAFLPSYYAAPRPWGPHPRKHMLMTPWLVFFGGIFAFAVPTLMGAFWQMMFFSPPLSDNFSPLTASAASGRVIYLKNECYVCHSSFVRPQDVRQGMYFTYPRVSHPGDFITSDDSPNVFGDERMGPDLSQEAGWHPFDWELAHFNNPRFVDPLSVMPRFSFLSDQQVTDLTNFVMLRSGKIGLVRTAGQEWAKTVFLIAGDGNGAPKLTFPPGFTGASLTLSQVAEQNTQGGPSGPSATVDGLPFPDVLSVNMAERGYWLMDDPLPPTTANLFRGRWVYQTFCLGCHGRGGDAVTYAAKFMAPRPIDFTHVDDATSGNDTSPGIYYYRILRGWKGSAMEEFGQRLSVKDIWRVVLFLKTIPNGTLQDSHALTPDDYIQWHPTPQLLTYVKKHPESAAREYQGPQTGSWPAKVSGAGPDAFVNEAIRIFPGLTYTDRIMLPGYGEVSLAAGASAIKAIYQKYLDQGWIDYAARGGWPPLPAAQKTIPPDNSNELR
jgi:cbb3-type cytochrome c oxidase subunit II